ncbi:MAG: hypothetical protein WCJ09_25455 [Planctomycetota bacterium]
MRSVLKHFVFRFRIGLLTALMIVSPWAGRLFNQLQSQELPAVRSESSWQDIEKRVVSLSERCQYPEAIALVSEYVQTDPSNYPAIECRIWLTFDYLDLKDMLSFPGRPLRRRTISDPLENTIVPPELDAKYAGANQARRSFFEVRFHSTYVHPVELENARQDLGHLQKLRGIEPHDAVVEAFIAEFTGDLRLAEQLIQKNQTERGNGLSPREHLLMSRILQTDKNFDAAIEAAEKAMAHPSIRNQSAARKATLLGKSGRKDEAARFLDDWKQKNPTDPMAAYLRVFLRDKFMTDEKELDECLHEMDSLDSLKELWAVRHYCVRFRWIRQFSKPGDIEKALSDVEAAIETDDQQYEPYFARSTLRYLQNEWEPAIQDVTKVIELTPYFDTAYGMRAAVYRRQGNYKQARIDESRAAWLKQLYSLHHKSALNETDPLAAYSLAQHLIKGKEWQWAALPLTQCLRCDPKYVNALRDRCEVYLQLGKLDLAMQDAESAGNRSHPISSE